MTYAAISKNILKSGQWKILHYSNFAHRDFYMHPPLFFWLEASVFKIFGVSEVSARLLPALFAWSTLTLLFFWVKRRATVGMAFLSGLVLLTSTRYVKFSSDVFLDGPLSFWMLLSWVAWDEGHRTDNKWNRRRWWFLSGFALTLGFLTKGLVVLAIPLAMLISSFWIKNGRSILLDFLSVGQILGIAVALLGPWLYWGDGVQYLTQYYYQSVMNRTSNPNPIDHFVPIMHLTKVHGPWLLFFFVGMFKLLRSEVRQFQKMAFIVGPMCVAIIVVGAFSWVGHSIEHYFLPFYVFASVLTAFGILQVPYLRHYKESAIVVFRFILLGVALFLCASPISIHAKRSPELQDAVDELTRRCFTQKFDEVVILENVEYIWQSVALIRWKTEWQAAGVSTAPDRSRSNQLLIARADEKVDVSQWVGIPYKVKPSIKIYRSAFAEPGSCLELE